MHVVSPLCHPLTGVPCLRPVPRTLALIRPPPPSLSLSVFVSSALPRGQSSSPLALMPPPPFLSPLSPLALITTSSPSLCLSPFLLRCHAASLSLLQTREKSKSDAEFYKLQKVRILRPLPNRLPARPHDAHMPPGTQSQDTSSCKTPRLVS